MLLETIKNLKTSENFIEAHYSTIEIIDELSPIRPIQIAESHNPEGSVEIIWETPKTARLILKLIHNSLYDTWGRYELIPFQCGKFFGCVRSGQGILYREDCQAIFSAMMKMQICERCEKAIFEGQKHSRNGIYCN